MKMTASLLLATASLLASPTALVAESPSLCETTELLPPALSAWRSAPAKDMTIGKPVDLALRPSTRVTFAVAPERASKPDSFGAVIDFAVAEPGQYQVALGDAGWIDIVDSGKALVSISHRHGPACSGIRKIVEFTLAPGTYRLQISGSAVAKVRALIVKS